MSGYAPPAPRRAPVAGPLLPRIPARMIGFALLGAVGAIAWGGMVTPARGWALLLFLAVACGAGGALAATRRLGVLGRAGAVVGVIALLTAAALLTSGVPARYLAPDAWPDLAAGIGQGIESLPNVRVPYGGADEWVHAVLLLCGTALLGLAALVAFFSRRPDALGRPVLAAAGLAAVVTVPAVQQPGDAPLVEGALLAVLLVTFLGLERVPRRAGPAAAGLVALATVAGVLFAPALDADRPLLDYESFAQSLTPEAGTRFSWDHRYGPMTWSRDGNEVLRVRAARGTYWKAETLTEFDGLRWRREPGADRRGLQTEIDRERPEWMQRLRVTVRDMTTEQFIGAGTVLSVSKAPRQPVASGPGEFRVEDRPLHRGHTYEVEAYVPRPTARMLALAGTRYPVFVADDLSVELPRPESGRPKPEIRFGPFGSAQATLATIDGRVVAGPQAEAAIEGSAYARTYALAQRLRADAATPYDYIQAVTRYLSRGFSYSESPPERAVPLASFLFEDKIGYCQQFSGAMALLLRMGGVPARIATGFSPGAYDRDRKEYVVRDLDAHSWVEAYVPGTGWVAFDPTPSGTPARSRQLAAPPTSATDNAQPRPAPGSERSRDPRPLGAGAAPAPEESAATPVLLIVIGVVLAGAAAGLIVVVVVRRQARERAPISVALRDLDRALARTGRAVPPGTTLSALATRMRGTPAEGYLLALQRARYGEGGPGPDARDRAGLRQALARRAGPLGRLRAWWALPPG